MINKMLITDLRIIINTDEDSFEEESSFLITDIEWIMISEINKGLFLKLHDHRTFYVSIKRRKETIELLKILYARLIKNSRLLVIEVPEKDLSKFHESQNELLKLNIEEEEEKKEKLEKKEKKNKRNFKSKDTGVNLGNELYEKLGDKFMEKEQKVLNNQKSSLLYSKKTYRHRNKSKFGIKKWKKLGDFNKGFIPNSNGDGEDYGVEPELSSESDEEHTEIINAKSASDSSGSSSDSSSDDESESPDPELKDFVLLKMINKGGFGKVFLAKNTLDDNYYAMKRIRKDLLIETKQIENTLNEKEILLSNNNPFLLKMDYVYQSEFRLYFFMEYINGGNLYENMFRAKRFKENQVKFFIAQITIALGYLHKNNVIHRDLKPENVILRENGYWVLADFGLAKILDSEWRYAQTYWGTSEYLCPEIINRKQQSFTVDWWALGILTYELIWGRTPFKDSNARRQNKKIWSGMHC